MVQKNMQNDKIILSISLLVSNRRDTIRKCMESLKPVLEAVPSELIAVDTVEPGKSDGSIEVVREYTENVIPFAWRNDFAAARNAGLEKAHGQWFMYIDDDEWLEDASPIIDFFRTGAYRKYRSAYYTVRSYTNPEGSRWVDTLLARLFLIEKDTRFEGRIHETAPVREPVCILPCCAHHYGYAFKNKEEKRRHIERNKTLLLEEYRKDPGNHYIAAHLIGEYEGAARFEESLKIIQESCRLSNHREDSVFWHYLKLHEVLGYACLKKFDKAYEAGLAYLRGENRLPGAETGIYSLMLEACDKLGRTEECMQYLETYLSKAEEIAKREDIMLQAVLGMNQYWNEINKKRVCAKGVTVAYQLGDMERTAYFIRKIDWKEKELQILEGTVENTLRFFEKVPYEPWMPEVMDAVLERGLLKEGIREPLSALPPDSAERRRLLQILASGKNTGAQISLCRAEYAALTKDTEMLRQALRELADNPDGNLLLLEERVLQYLCGAGVKGGDYVGKVPFYRWFSCAAQWDGEKDLAVKRRECLLWRAILPGDSLYLLCVEASLGQAELRREAEEGKDFQAMHQSFLGMAEKAHRMYAQIYHPDAFEREERFTILPPDAQFAEKYLSAARCLEQEDRKGFVSCVKEAGMCCPAMGKACKRLLENYLARQAEEEKESRKVQEELAVLMRNLERRAQLLWESGREAEAAAIIKQILQIQPDAELAAKYHITI